MPFTVAPNVIEQSDFTGGWIADGDPVSADPIYLEDVKNLLPNPVTGSLGTRKGFKRVREEVLGGGTHKVIQVFKFQSHFNQTRHDYLLCILTTGLNAANNVRVYAIDQSNYSVTRIDDAGVNWDNPTELHWGMGVQGVWYGGSRGNKMYSWNPDGDVWTADASVDPDWKTWVTDTEDDAGLNLNTEWPKDYAWKGTERVKKGSDYFIPRKSIRYATWDSGQRYDKGDRVSVKVDWGSNVYWVSWKCENAHTASAANKPGEGGSYGTYWNKVKLESPTNDDDETGGDWDDVPLAAETSVAEWHAGRLWLRYDGSGERDRVQFSAPLQVKHGQRIGDLEFDPTDFAPGNDKSGPGGGWLNFNDGSKSGVVTALKSYAGYLLVFKRQAVWAVSGQSEDTFSVRHVARGKGATNNEAVTEHMDSTGRDLVYFISEDGLYRTDGTEVGRVPGSDRVRDYISTRVADMLDDEAAYVRPRCWSFGPYVWVSLPLTASDVTLAYHPETESWWYTNLPIMDVALGNVDRVERMWFVAHPTYGGDLVYEYDHTDVASTPTDDTGAADYASAEIDWSLRTVWWPFGLEHAERRIRRVWALVKGVAQTFTIAAYRDYSSSSAVSTARVSTNAAVQYIEGAWFADSHAVKFSVSGTKAATEVYGVAVHTEPRRIRYHKGG